MRYIVTAASAGEEPARQPGATPGGIASLLTIMAELEWKSEPGAIIRFSSSPHDHLLDRAWKDCVSELMKSAPAPAVMDRINPFPGTTVFLPAIAQAEIHYGIALISKGSQRERLTRAAAPMSSNASDRGGLAVGCRRWAVEGGAVEGGVVDGGVVDGGVVGDGVSRAVARC